RAHLAEMAEQPGPAFVLGLHALDLRAADRIGERGRLGAQEQRLAAVDLQRVDVLAARKLEAPRPLRRGPLAEAAGPRAVGLLVARLVEARQRAVRGAREQAAITHEACRVVRRLERAIRRQSAFEGAALLHFQEARHGLL